MHEAEYSVAMTARLGEQLSEHLVRDDGQEDLVFGLWTPSEGDKRQTALVHTIIYPEPGDRQRHGNVSFNKQYFERVCQIALSLGKGIVFMHSHPVPGWQDMSLDDIEAEKRLMKSAYAITGLPLVGMTVGSDETWSARFWAHSIDGSFERVWCTTVRRLGKQLTSDFNDALFPRPQFSEMFKRTLTVWGEENHSQIARLKVGIVGLGSVGGCVAAALARSGFTRLCFIDHDEIQLHNLDRLEYATKENLGQLKVEVARNRALHISTASSLEIDAIANSVAEEKGYRAALDCDVLFSCVDRPRPRAILNHIAYAHLIPVIDGGISVRFKSSGFAGVDWQLQTVGPERPCLECLGAFSWDDVSSEIEGSLDNPTYMSGLPEDHRFRRNENVYPFSQNLASLEMLHFYALTTACAGIDDFGVQRFRYNPGILEADMEKSCSSECKCREHIATGDSLFTLYGEDVGARNARQRQGSLTIQAY